VHPRIFLAVGAWLLGAGAATGGSLVAVSLLGQSLAAPPTQQLTVSAVNRALASESKEPTPAPTRTTPTPTPTASPSPSPSTAPAAMPGGKLLVSAGGSVVAGCGPSGAYLVSWSPQQGYQVEDVVRGPAARPSVTFMAGSSGVRMVVSCAAGLPSAVISTVQGDDDGGPGDD